MIKPRYKLDVTLAIAKQEWNGPITPNGEPDETQGYWRDSHHNERLTVNETLQLGSMDFLGLMKVLAQLHEAITEISK